MKLIFAHLAASTREIIDVLQDAEQWVDRATTFFFSNRRWMF
jgi:hypothetical protein